MNQNFSIHSALQDFAASVTAKMTQVTLGEPEDQLRGPFETFLAEVGHAFGWNVVCTGETPLPDRLGRPDYAVHLNQLLAGYVELKAPGVGATASRFKGHNRDQFRRFSAIPNILYTDGNEWVLYRDGKQVRGCHLSGDVAADGKEAAVPQDTHAVEDLLRDFLLWEPSIPVNRNRKIDLNRFAELLAPLCRMLRDDVMDALKDPASPLVLLAQDWRQLLFPSASDEQFADAYAQTVTFALLLGRSEGADPLTLGSARDALAVQHNLLSRALQVLTDPNARADIAASLDLLLRVISVVPPATLSGPEDPWLYFYENFLAKYDPKLRRDAGAYYTPVEVVRAQVRLIDDLLVNRLGKPLGFADPSVVTLDPAVGTGTYLLGVIEHALGRIEEEQGAGAVAGQATALAKNLYGFELLVGPYAVSELRVSRALHDCGADLPQDGTHLYLTDTLESPHASPPQSPLFLQPIAEQHAKALKVKSKVPVIVCLGNPPYDRHEADSNKARTGGWIRWGEEPLRLGLTTASAQFFAISSTRPLTLDTASTSKTSITSMPISGAGRCGRSLSKTPPKAPASSASSARRATSTATLSLGCANISVGNATRFGFSTLAARDAGRARMTMSLLSRRQWPLPWRSVRGRWKPISPRKSAMPGLRGYARRSSPRSPLSTALRE